jgi:hypothetical protein
MQFGRYVLTFRRNVLRLSPSMKMEAARLLRKFCVCTKLHGVTTRKTVIFTLASLDLDKFCWIFRNFMFGAIFRRVLFMLLFVFFLSTVAVEFFHLDVVFYLLLFIRLFVGSVLLLLHQGFHVSIFSIPSTYSNCV